MSNCDTCDFVFDRNDHESWDRSTEQSPYVSDEVWNENGVWTCPHDQFDENSENNKCIFHMQPDEKDDEVVVEEFLRVLDEIATSMENDQITRKHQFFKAKFGDFDISHRSDLPDIDKKISLNYCLFKGEFNVSEITFDTPVDISGSKFLGYSEYSGAEFKQGLKSRDTEHLSANFLGVEFRSADFTYSDFLNKVIFSNAKFYNITLFQRCEFHQRARFQRTVFEDRTIFTKARFGTFEIGYKNPSFKQANLTGVDFSGVSLHNANLESALLSRASFFDSDLRGAQLAGAVLGDIRINGETQFLGPPSNDDENSSHTLSAIRSTPRCVYESNYQKENGDMIDRDKAKSTYQAIEEVARKAALPRLQSQCFVRRQDIQKNIYWQDMKESNSLIEKIIAGGRYGRAKTARETLLYGESPWRIIIGSAGFILFMGLLYPLGEWLEPVGGDPITYDRISESPELILETLYFSTLTFTTLGMGDYNPIGFGQALATMNTAFGAILIALLVFVLGRRAAR